MAQKYGSWVIRTPKRTCAVECWRSTPSFRTTDAWLGIFGPFVVLVVRGPPGTPGNQNDSGVNIEKDVAEAKENKLFGT